MPAVPGVGDVEIGGTGAFGEFRGGRIELAPQADVSGVDALGSGASEQSSLMAGCHRENKIVVAQFAVPNLPGGATRNPVSGSFQHAPRTRIYGIAVLLVADASGIDLQRHAVLGRCRREHDLAHRRAADVSGAHHEYLHDPILPDADRPGEAVRLPVHRECGQGRRREPPLRACFHREQWCHRPEDPGPILE